MRTTGPAMPSGPSLVGRDQELAAVQACLNGALSGKLKASNSGNYAAWSADWSEALKDAIREKDFLSFREQAIATAGRYVSIAGSDVRKAKTPGYLVYAFRTQFENGPMSYYLTFAVDGTQVEGAFLQPAS